MKYIRIHANVTLNDNNQHTSEVNRTLIKLQSSHYHITLSTQFLEAGFHCIILKQKGVIRQELHVSKTHAQPIGQGQVKPGRHVQTELEAKVVCCEVGKLEIPGQPSTTRTLVSRLRVSTHGQRVAPFRGDFTPLLRSCSRRILIPHRQGQFWLYHLKVERLVRKQYVPILTPLVWSGRCYEVCLTPGHYLL